jgi:acetyl esterase/lipase
MFIEKRFLSKADYQHGDHSSAGRLSAKLSERASCVVLRGARGKRRGTSASLTGVGEFDLLVQQNIGYVRRLTQTGLPIEIHCCSGGPHSSGLVFASLARVHKDDQSEALRAAFATVERPC